jgi:hypothetical protein
MEIEVDSELFIHFVRREKAHIYLRSRLIYNRQTENIRMIADPMLMNTKCHIKRVQNLCECNQL